MRFLCGFKKYERSVTDDARFVSRGVARIAQIQLLRLQSVFLRGQKQSIDRRRAAGLLMVDHRVEIAYPAGRLGVDLDPRPIVTAVVRGAVASASE